MVTVNVKCLQYCEGTITLGSVLVSFHMVAFDGDLFELINQYVDLPDEDWVIILYGILWVLVLVVLQRWSSNPLLLQYDACTVRAHGSTTGNMVRYCLKKLSGVYTP